jgi:uncharacterized membrane protein
MKELDLSNIEGLDESLLDTYEGFSNVSASKLTEQATGCKKPLALNPLVSILTGGVSNLTYKKKKKQYEECLANFKRKQASDLAQAASASSAAVAAAEKAKKELEETKAELAASKDGSGSGSNRSRENSDDDGGGDKFLGMPKAVGITVTVVGGLALIVGGIFLVKKLRK